MKIATPEGRRRLPIRVLIAEDEAAERAIRTRLSSEDALELVAFATDVDDAVRQASSAQPDVALLDASIPGGGLRAARELTEVSPSTRAIAIFHDDDRETAVAMLVAGAVACVAADAATGEIVDAVKRAVRGQSSLSTDLLVDLADRERRRPVVRRAAISRLVHAGEEERRRIAADIHDDSIQVMTAAGMRLQILRRSLVSADQISSLDELAEAIRLAIARLRRLIADLHPPSLDLEGLAASLRLYVEVLATETETVYIVDGSLGAEPAEPVRLALYRIAQEALTNVRKHAQARNVTITLGDRDLGVHVRIEDDGVGFALSPDHPAPDHLGIGAIRELAELANGWLEIDSTPGVGTRVEYWVPSDTGALVR